jgi:peptidoglycan hydrolase CwlO-like protein
MSEAIIVAIITGSVTVIGFVFNYFSNKKKFDKLANNDMKHGELDPNGETMRAINSNFSELKQDVSELKRDMSDVKQDVKGIKHYAYTLDGILLDKGVLSNQQAATLNTHLDG